LTGLEAVFVRLRPIPTRFPGFRDTELFDLSDVLGYSLGSITGEQRKGGGHEASACGLRRNVRVNPSTPAINPTSRTTSAP